MKGLLIKDFCLLRNQRRILPIYLMLAVWFTAMHNDGFGFPFLMMMATILTVSTISIDETDHGQTHLFTLPFERKTYVGEKFVLGGILTAASIALATACSVLRMLISPDASASDLGMLAFVSLCGGAVFLALMIPIRIRFGGDQGRIMLYVGFALISLVCVLISRVIPGAQEEVSAFFARMNMTGAMLAAAGAMVLFLAAGYYLGVRWMEKKEF